MKKIFTVLLFSLFVLISSCNVVIEPISIGAPKSYLDQVDRIEYLAYAESDYAYKMKITKYKNGERATEIYAFSETRHLVSGDLSFRVYDHTGNGSWDFIRFYDESKEFTFRVSYDKIFPEFDGAWPVSEDDVRRYLRIAYKAKNVVSKKGTRVSL